MSIIQEKLTFENPIIAGKYVHQVLTEGTDKLVILDLRDKKDFDKGHLPGALNFPFGEGGSAWAEQVLPHIQPSDIILFTCYFGLKSENGRDILRKYGFKNILTMKGGMFSWDYDLVNTTV